MKKYGWQERECIRWERENKCVEVEQTVFSRVSAGLLLGIQFYFSVLKFTLENEIPIVMIESRTFVFHKQTHNCTPCTFDGISMKSLKMFPKKNQICSQV